VARDKARQTTSSNTRYTTRCPQPHVHNTTTANTCYTCLFYSFIIKLVHAEDNNDDDDNNNNNSNN